MIGNKFPLREGGRPKAGMDCPEGAEFCKAVNLSYESIGETSISDIFLPLR